MRNRPQITSNDAPTGAPGHLAIFFSVSTVVVLILCAATLAGPPFATDDPFSLPFHTGESYLFASGTHSADGTILDAAPGIETNFSFFRNTFLHLVVPSALNRPSGRPSSYGIGDLEIGFKWLLPTPSKRWPEIGIFPFLEVPTGDADRSLGSGKAQVYLPVWLGKESDTWTTYGGGGYWINPGEGNRNWWFTGFMLQRQLTGRLYLGAEVFHQTADAIGAKTSTGFNIGGGLIVTDPYQVLFSAGRNIQDVGSNQFSFYLAIYRTF